MLGLSVIDDLNNKAASSDVLSLPFLKFFFISTYLVINNEVTTLSSIVTSNYNDSLLVYGGSHQVCVWNK